MKLASTSAFNWKTLILSQKIKALLWSLIMAMISKRLNHHPIAEPLSKGEVNSESIEHYSQIQDPAHRGAIFMAVCRGRVSEGLDFANVNGRDVAITEIPFLPLKDPWVIVKQQYLDENSSTKKDLPQVRPSISGLPNMAMPAVSPEFDHNGMQEVKFSRVFVIIMKSWKCPSDFCHRNNIK
ncbi:hypothetical protein QAD02_000496 [Eretmocerus hayati]|uniref:Uncharacterized protein n=1 Tax=Eretmocerus hayati TaxID=131215 RepID=A0ACC2NG65_9HYME|nr:hypothetical protein QAD02_000496 [Eretmocerus hayati]